MPRIQALFLDHDRTCDYCGHQRGNNTFYAGVDPLMVLCDSCKTKEESSGTKDELNKKTHDILNKRIAVLKLVCDAISKGVDLNDLHIKKNSEGVNRPNGMGKRVNYSGRTVITSSKMFGTK